MSYRENLPHGAGLILGRLTAAIVVLLAILFVPFGAVAAGFWGADIGLFALHVVEFSVLPCLAIPLAFAKADALYADGDHIAGTMVRSSPLALQLFISPILMLLTTLAWRAIV